MSLVQILEDHVENITALIDCTRRERDAIVYNRIQEMGDIAFEKSGLLRRSSELEQARESTCADILGTPYAANTSMQEVLGRLPAEIRPQLEKLRNQLKEKSFELHRENEINAVLMRDQLEYARFMLSIMCGTIQKDFYAANGAKRPPAEGTILNRKG